MIEQKMKSAGPVAADHGAEFKAASFNPDTYTKNSQTAMSKWAKPSHKRAAKALGFAATIGTSDAWLAASGVWAARLTIAERVSLAFAALRALDHDTATQTAQAALYKCDMPIAPLFNHMDEAAFWADLAEPDAVEAYCLAAFHAMPPARQSDFLAYAQGRAAA